jgi:HD-like signal output (HDOD) protein
MLPAFSRARNNVARRIDSQNEANLTCKLPMYEAVASYCRETRVRDADVLELMRLANSDPATATEILVLANSPASVYCAKIYSLPDAVAVLGSELTASVIVRLANWTTGPRKFDPEALHRIWAHGIAAAVIGREISSSLAIPKAVGYAVGLLHDVGRLGLLSASPAEYSALASNSLATTAEALECEEKLLGMDHCKAGHWLTGTWGLPPAFANAAVMHHGEGRADRAEAGSLAAIACQIAERIGYSESAAEVRCDSEDTAEVAERLRGRFNVDLDRLRHEIQQTIWFFDSRIPQRPRAGDDEGEPRREESAVLETRCHT